MRRACTHLAINRRGYIRYARIEVYRTCPVTSIRRKSRTTINGDSSRAPTTASSRTLVRTALRKLEVDALARQTLVDLAVGVEPVVHTTPLLLVEHDLEYLAAVLASANALADDLNRVNEVGEDSIVNGRQRAGARALLGLRGAAAVAALGARQDAARCDDEDVAVGELLLQLAGEAVELSA